MASDQVGGDEADRRRRHRRRTEPERRHESTTGSSSQPTSILPPEATFDRPSDLSALREARLKSMETPAISRNKMKTEYQATRPLRSPSVTKSRSRSSTAVSIGLFGRKSSSAFIKPKTTAAGTAAGARRQQGDRSIYQSVYGSPDSAGDEDKQMDTDDKSGARPSKSSIERRKSRPPTEKPRKDRRKTEPTPAMRRSATAPTLHTPLKRSGTSTRNLTSQQPSAMPSSSVVVETSPDMAKPAKPQRTASILGSLFAKPPPVPEKQVSCLTCGSDDVPITKSAKLPCEHRMCHTCLKRIFKMSVKDPAHMPPRCCTQKHISLKHVDSLFDDDFKKTWNKKFKEFNAKNRIYCPRKDCGEWIQPKHFRVEQGRKTAACPKCKTSVCTVCNQKAHKSRECPKDPALKQLNEMADQKGWVKCFNCSAMIELKEGCNHMTCRCMAEFCMVCGLKWKSCDCAWFNYEAVGDLRGDPLRHQQEMDRRGEQLRRDEDMARQLAGLHVRGERRLRRLNGQAPARADAGRDQPDADFVQQARDALTGGYQTGEVAARGLLGGWLRGRNDLIPPAMPGGFDDTPEVVEQPAEEVRAEPVPRRRAYRLRRADVGGI